MVTRLSKGSKLDIIAELRPASILSIYLQGRVPRYETLPLLKVDQSDGRNNPTVEKVTHCKRATWFTYNKKMDVREDIVKFATRSTISSGKDGNVDTMEVAKSSSQFTAKTAMSELKRIQANRYIQAAAVVDSQLESAKHVEILSLPPADKERERGKQMDFNEQDLVDISLRKQKFVQSVGPLEIASDVEYLLSELAKYRRKEQQYGWMDTDKKMLIAAFRHLACVHNGALYQPKECSECYAAQKAMNAMRGGEA
jgi:hypothetical protein